MKLKHDEVTHLIDLVDLHRDSVKDEYMLDEAKQRVYEFDTLLLEKLKEIQDGLMGKHCD